MTETYACTFADCDKVFSRAYELRKHKVAHENPNSVFHCPLCEFITLQKKNLAIHFAAHTGEKNYECPDMVISELRCDYRTHDPAALSKHRKKCHGYVPPPNRSRPRALPLPPNTRQRTDVKAPRRRRRSQLVGPSPRRKTARSSHETKNSTMPTPANPILLSPALEGNVMDVDCDEDFDYDSGVAALVGTDDELGLDILFDPSLRSRWMAEYEMSYTSFDTAGMSRQLEPLANPCPDLALLDVKTDREGCLCPEWMVEAGIEGWDESVLAAHNEYYTIAA